MIKKGELRPITQDQVRECFRVFPRAHGRFLSKVFESKYEPVALRPVTSDKMF